MGGSSSKPIDSSNQNTLTKCPVLKQKECPKQKKCPVLKAKECPEQKKCPVLKAKECPKQKKCPLVNQDIVTQNENLKNTIKMLSLK